MHVHNSDCEMDPPSVRSHPQRDQVRHPSIGDQHTESKNGRSLEGVTKLHSHKIVSSALLSDAGPGVRHGHGSSTQSVVRPKQITSKERIQQSGQKSKTTYNNGIVESEISLKPSYSMVSSESYSVFKGGADEHYYEGSALPFSNPNYSSLFDNHDQGEIVSGSHHQDVKLGRDATDKKITATTTQPARQKERGPTTPTRFRTQSMNIAYATSILPRAQKQLSPHEPRLAGTAAEARASQSWRPSLVDHRSSSKQPSQHLQLQKANSENTSTKLLNHSTSSNSLPRHELFRHKSEISTNIFAKHKADSSRLEHSSLQGNAAMPLSLHLSLPDISSESHGGKTKSTNDEKAFKMSFEHLFEPENVKTKVKSVWNNIRFGWAFKARSSFNYDSPLFMLGKCYHKRKDDPSTEPEEQFLRDFVSRIWLTYRSNFYPIPGTKLSTDCGWGCMLRSGQMLIAQCLVTHFLGRDWQLYNKQTDTESVFYREIIRWFSDPLDAPSDKTPFCLHHLTHFGRAYNKDPGKWYGPASVAYIFRDTFIKASQSIPILSQLCLYVAQDCTVYIEDVLSLCTERQRSESVNSSSEIDVGASSQKQEKWLRSVIILVPMRLGGEVTNEIYAPCVQSLLSHDNCMGIIGGRPRHSLYFLGWQDTKLIYLDPHLCREAVDTTVSDFKIETFHCMTPRKLAIRKMDPSCAVGFYIKNEDDFKHFVQEVKEFISPPKQKGIYPLFTFANGRQCDSDYSQSQPVKDRRVRVTHYHIDQYGQKTLSGESEEFVML